MSYAGTESKDNVLCHKFDMLDSTLGHLRPTRISFFYDTHMKPRFIEYPSMLVYVLEMRVNLELSQLSQMAQPLFAVPLCQEPHLNGIDRDFPDLLVTAPHPPLWNSENDNEPTPETMNERSMALSWKNTHAAKHGSKPLARKQRPMRTSEWGNCGTFTDSFDSGDLPSVSNPTVALEVGYFANTLLCLASITVTGQIGSCPYRKIWGSVSFEAEEDYEGMEAGGCIAAALGCEFDGDTKVWGVGEIDIDISFVSIELCAGVQTAAVDHGNALAMWASALVSVGFNIVVAGLSATGKAKVLWVQKKFSSSCCQHYPFEFEVSGTSSFTFDSASFTKTA